MLRGGIWGLLHEPLGKEQQLPLRVCVPTQCQWCPVCHLGFSSRVSQARDGVLFLSEIPQGRTRSLAIGSVGPCAAPPGKPSASSRGAVLFLPPASVAPPLSAGVLLSAMVSLPKNLYTQVRDSYQAGPQEDVSSQLLQNLCSW